LTPNSKFSLHEGIECEVRSKCNGLFQRLKKLENFLKSSQNKEQINALDTREERLYLEESVFAFSPYEKLLNKSYKHFSVSLGKDQERLHTIMQTQLSTNQSARTMLIII